MHKIIFDVQPGESDQEAFLLLSHDWHELALASGAGVLDWGPRVWVNVETPLCFDVKEVKRMRPGRFDYAALYGLAVTAQSKGYTGPLVLPAIEQWGTTF